AKIDYLCNGVEEDDLEVVVTRQEQNGGMIGEGIGGLRGKGGVGISRSGRGVSKLTSGSLSASCEGEGVLGMGGEVKRNELLGLTDESIDNG
ncbi:thiamine pyrophosphate-binding protein, partial [Staphylococcus epidermidis]|uniref:thiamine pyrophosphate-binding protein n=1 Tax=Staphylococcus epidermidis TaxID=1282 RepID=UPI0037DA441A